MLFLLRHFFIYIILLWSLHNLYSKPLYISLGGACAPAINLRNLGLRTQAYPFDWIISPFESLYQALNEDFKYFLEDTRIVPKKTGVIDHYHFYFTHDWQKKSLAPDESIIHPDWEKSLPAVKEKYQRRIDRFRKACRGSETVYFIRAEYITQEQAIKLRGLFRTKYPTLYFLLIVFNNSEDFKEPWHIDSIRNFYLPSWDDVTAFEETLKKILY